MCIRDSHGPAPIPEEGQWVKAYEIKDISGLDVYKRQHFVLRTYKRDGVRFGGDPHDERECVL